MDIHLVEWDFDTGFIQFIIYRLIQIEEGIPIIGIFYPYSQLKIHRAVAQVRHHNDWSGFCHHKLISRSHIQDYFAGFVNRFSVSNAN